MQLGYLLHLFGKCIKSVGEKLIFRSMAAMPLRGNRFLWDYTYIRLYFDIAGEWVIRIPQKKAFYSK